MEYIAVGEVLKPQGIKGAVKVRPLTDNPQQLQDIAVVYIDNVLHAMREVSCAGGFAFVHFEGVSNRDQAEAFRGKLLLVERGSIAPPEEGAYLIADLIGCRLTDEKGKTLGKITQIDAFGAADVITCTAPNGKEFRFPFLLQIVDKIDVAQKRFSVIRKLWQEVSVFDD
ncbi:MAG: ribosome maturation factor RimM [Firmicutes bacterium]|nr:ribosome maturation factor RimM [Bacillota bacterium]